VELADTSAWTSRRRSETASYDFQDRLERGGIATCDAVVFELLWNERDPGAVSARRSDLDGLRSVAIGSGAARST
jgi:hypothetical protein